MRRNARGSVPMRWRLARMRARNSSAAHPPISSATDMRLLVTRPEPDAEGTAQALRRRGHEVLVAPLLRTEMVEAEFGGPYGGVLMTSANAARAVGRHARFDALRMLPVLAVGDRTAEAARAAGFANVESSAGALPDLVRLASARARAGSPPLLHLAGEDRAGDLAGALRRVGHRPSRRSSSIAPSRRANCRTTSRGPSRPLGSTA